MIEDDGDLCASWVEIFELIGYDIACYQSGGSALADRDAVLGCALMISDFYLPDINGVELIMRARALRPGLKAMLLTGSRDSTVVEAAKKLPDCAILHKPVNIEEIESRLAKMLKR